MTQRIRAGPNGRLRNLLAPRLRHVVLHKANVVAFNVDVESLDAFDVGVDLGQQHEVLCERLGALRVVVQFDVMQNSPARGR